MQNAADLFNNPDGTVTDDNANEAVQQAIEATQANSLGQAAGPFGFSPTDATPKGIMDCISVNGTSSVVDYACLGPEIGQGCVGSGTITTDIIDIASDGSSFTANTQYNNAALTCGGTEPVVCNGPAQTSFSGGTTVTCLDLTCTLQGESSTTNGCFTFDQELGSNLVLVTLDDGSVVCIAVVANADCSRACSEWRDAEGDAIITCDITATTGTCDTDGTTIEEVDNCVLDRTQSSCANFE